jgi:hypothetical protein
MPIVEGVIEFLEETLYASNFPDAVSELQRLKTCVDNLVDKAIARRTELRLHEIAKHKQEAADAAHKRQRADTNHKRIKRLECELDNVSKTIDDS